MCMYASVWNDGGYHQSLVKPQATVSPRKRSYGRNLYSFTHAQRAPNTVPATTGSVRR
eukprot:m.182767 g.182767  ORF g.182767 m.182767 type:complete len:58 (-) comp18470_c0_seq3:1004-1177(-)